ncbi:MAG: hypothetical protein WDO70_12350 [Alphaproteobacteria bacterium]
MAISDIYHGFRRTAREVSRQAVNSTQDIARSIVQQGMKTALTNVYPSKFTGLTSFAADVFTAFRHTKTAA